MKFFLYIISQLNNGIISCFRRHYITLLSIKKKSAPCPPMHYPLKTAALQATRHQATRHQATRHQATRHQATRHQARKVAGTAVAEITKDVLGWIELWRPRSVRMISKTPITPPKLKFWHPKPENRRKRPKTRKSKLLTWKESSPRHWIPKDGAMSNQMTAWKKIPPHLSRNPN